MIHDITAVLGTNVTSPIFTSPIFTSPSKASTVCSVLMMNKEEITGGVGLDFPKKPFFGFQLASNSALLVIFGLTMNS